VPPLPERVCWAVELLPPALDGAILEVGCAAGLALPLLLARYPAAPVTAIDRSEVQIARARARCASAVASGRLRLHTLGLEAAPDALGDGSSALVLAINVNAFWVTPSPSLRSAAALLEPGGRLHLVYEPPDDTRLRELASTLPTLLARHGFRVTEVTQTRFHASGGLCVAGMRAEGEAGRSAT
jgi:SAM-dependent methyltransferase